MATTTLISVEEYLKTSAHPDYEYVRGVLKERAVPEYNHAVWQEAILAWFRAHKSEWGVRALPELRVQVATDNYRVPDVTILSSNAPREQVITYPPLAVFEILSPTDAMTDVLEKLGDYQERGIAAIWLVNPKKEPKKPKCYVYSSGNLTPAVTFELPGTSFQVAMSDIAALID
jgi:Uma2 family endonuclease